MLSPFQRHALKATRRLDIPDADCKGEKDSGYVGRSAADGHQCCPFIPGGDLGMSRLEGSFSQLTRRKSLRRVGYRPALSRLGDLAAWGARLRAYASGRSNQMQCPKWVKPGKVQNEHMSSALPPIATDARTSSMGSFVPQAAVSGCNKVRVQNLTPALDVIGLVLRPYSSQSITLSTRASSNGGIVNPNAFAVLRLITSSNLVGC